MTITRKRAMSAVFGAAALSAAAACPATSAADTSSPIPSTSEHHAKPQRRPPARRGPYVYKAMIGAEVSTTTSNMLCSGATIRFVGVKVVGEGERAEALWERRPSARTRRFTVVTGPATTISVPWNSEQEKREASEHEGSVPNPKGVWATAPASRVCAATTANATLGSVGEGVVTWRLHTPAASVASLLAQPPANVAINELVSGFTIQPNGAVPTFGPGS